MSVQQIPSSVDWGSLVESIEALRQFALTMATGKDGGPTVKEVLDEFVAAKERAARSPRYVRQLRLSVRSLAGLGVSIRAVTARDVERMLAGKLAARTQRNRLLTVRTFFNFAVRRGYAPRNPAATVDLPAPPAAPPALHSPAQVRAVLETARRVDLNVMRWLAVRYFAGLRGSEAQHLAEDHIRAEFIEVTAAKAKTRTRRLIVIPPNLHAWLAAGGRLPLTDANTRTARVAKALRVQGVPWPKNVTRHSWCSYHLAAHGSAAKTALEAGHSEAMLFRHYRELVTGEAAREFFSIRPQNGQMELKWAA